MNIDPSATTKQMIHPQRPASKQFSHLNLHEAVEDEICRQLQRTVKKIRNLTSLSINFPDKSSPCI
jgi:hypothetical protein